MYDLHNPIIAAECWENAETFRKACLFAILSIRQPIILVPEQLEHVLKHGEESPYLLGHKRRAFHYLQEHHVELWRDVRNAETPQEAIGALMRVPGLGIVKSAFIAQLCGLDVACLDSRNNKRLNLNPSRYRVNFKHKHGKAAKRKIDAYVSETGGKAREFWDAWCIDVAQAYTSTPQEISALHLAIVQ